MTSNAADSIRLNRWASAAHDALGDWLGEHQAEYVGCAVDDDGTRQLRWQWPTGELGASPGRRRELLVRSLAGDLDGWELVFREVKHSPRGGRVRHYASTSTTGLNLDQLRHAVIELVDAGLEHLGSPTATCGHNGGDNALFITALGALVLAVLTALSMALGWPWLIQMLLFPATLLCTGGLIVQAAQRWFLGY
ncbi:hypothetical protein [Saccharopolyspora sp. NPDC049357]|uniref:hypothetical protein n=1 Tax=Saccharopolyspora sp. NPDC049357 TaxID=3154507 RepID=UPI00343CD896